MTIKVCISKNGKNNSDLVKKLFRVAENDYFEFFQKILIIVELAVFAYRDKSGGRWMGAT